MTELQKYSDAAMFDAVPIEDDEPKVHLLWMTPDPLGAVAAMCRMYEGYPTYSLRDITDDDRRNYWEQVQKTHLKAPLEAVKFHFFIEGVDRAFTHQMVRQRTAVYAQESMRFAVKRDLPTSTPPGLTQTQALYWEKFMKDIEGAYNTLIDLGVPAEDARGILPHATLTRLNYVTDLRSILDHAGNRLCTQAQFHWRKVFIGIAQAIRNFGDPYGDPVHHGIVPEGEEWQFQELSKLFQPVCYQMGKCPFKAKFDRGCTIRERVDHFEKMGTPSSEWHDEEKVGKAAINPAEWLMFHDSAYVKPGDPYGDQSHRRS